MLFRSQVKDSVSSAPWKIQRKPKPGESNADRKKAEREDGELQRLNEFFQYPDGETNWSTWIRPFLEDVLVLDAGSILMRRKYSGEIAQLRVIRGDSITRYIDQNGWTPQGDSPAYAQLWQGIPYLNLTTSQLVYRPNNIVPRSSESSNLYGMSPTEQLAQEIETGIQRMNFVLAFYTEGSTPGIVQIVPGTVLPDTISKTMQALNSNLAGNLAARRQIRLLQGFTADGSDQIKELKEPVLADVFDELHIRKLAFGYGTSAQRLLRMMNRAASESNQDAAEDEGELPWFLYLKSTMDFIIQRQMQRPDYEWVPDLVRELDASKRAEADKKDVDTGIRTRDEVRIDRGLDAFGSPEAASLMITTATGAVPLDGAIERLDQDRESKNRAQEEAAKQPKAAPPGSAGNAPPEEKPKPNEKEASAKKAIPIRY